MKKYIVVASSNSKKEIYRSKLYNTQYGAWLDMLRIFNKSLKNGKWAGRIVLKEISNNKIKNIAWREA